MKLLSVEPRALLIQGIYDYQCMLYDALRSIAPQIVQMGLNENQLIEWILKQQLEDVYCLFPINHDSHSWHYQQLHEQVKNQIDLDRLTGQYIQVPKLYGDHCFIDLEIRGIDLYMWYYKHDQLPANYSYKRKWN